MKTPFLENQKDLSSHTGIPDLAPLILPRQQPIIGLRN